MRRERAKITSLGHIKPGRQSEPLIEHLSDNLVPQVGDRRYVERLAGASLLAKVGIDEPV